MNEEERNMETTRLRDGTLVLAKLYKGELDALTYANRTQADQAAKREGGEVIQRGRVFFVSLPETFIWTDHCSALRSQG